MRCAYDAGGEGALTLYLACVSPVSRLYLACISPISDHNADSNPILNPNTNLPLPLPLPYPGALTPSPNDAAVRLRRAARDEYAACLPHNSPIFPL